MRKSTKPKALWVQIRDKGTRPEPTKKKWIKPRSKKLATATAQYVKIAKAFRAQHKTCQCCWNNIQCLQRSTEIHHMAGRRGSALTDTTNFLAVCSMHHRMIHDNPVDATKQGFLKPEGWR
jgi:hypothetical protein